ncbi:MAG: universal stress protein [Candidatus Nitrosopolaris sp.]|jgi:nucleotide-binding universal stress UspA family protein
MTTNVKSTDSNAKVQIKKILVPIDGSECSLNAAEYAVKVAKDENAQLYCIHVIGSVPYGYAAFPPAIDQYFKDLEQKVQSWFDKIKDMAKNQGIPEVKTETFTDVKSIVGSIIDYATTRDIDLIVIGTRGRTGLKRFLMGSVANGVVQHAHCSVLLVR